MSPTNKDIALLIIDYLKSSVKSKTVAEDYFDSMDVAIDCIADAFEVDKDDESISKGEKKSLVDLLHNVPTSSSKPETQQVDPKVKDQADALKVEGNKSMALKDYPQAIEKYTQAIELDPTNHVYLSNRAAAYSSNKQHDSAIKDAELAIQLNPDFSKAYSRLGLAKYAIGDAKGAMEAYKKGLDIEGDAKSDAMRKGYETAKKRVEEELENSIQTRDEPQQESSNASSTTPQGGMPDFSSMFGGGGAGGMPNFAEMMNNPQLMQAAQEMMSNPGAMQNLFNNPAVKQMAQNLGLGGENGPDLSNLMNNPMLSQFMNRNNNNNGNNESSE